MAGIPCVVLHQDGDEEKTFLFPASLFDQVAALVEPKKIRRLSEEHKAKLVEASKPYRIKPGSNSPPGERQAPRTTTRDQELPRPNLPRIMCHLLGVNLRQAGGGESEGRSPSSAVVEPLSDANADLGRGWPDRSAK